MAYNKLIFELSQPGRTGYKLPELDVEEKDNLIPEEFLSNEELDLPEVSEVDVVRHYTNLSTLNFGVDTGMYPLGSCTMKYNPKINEEIIANPKLARLHPKQDDYQVQGALEAMYTLQKSLCEISAMDYMTLQPAAGAHGEITAITIFKKYHEVNGNSEKNEIIVPDSAHGTNPATAAMAGYKVVEVKSNEKGVVDVEDLRKVVNEKTAGLMLTNPNTLGLFETKIKEIAEIVHEAGGLLYYDGANANAILGHARPGDMGFDAIHFNVHKTFSTPHGGGGPGAGPVGVKKFLREYLPKPIVEKDGDKYFLDYSMEHSIGRMKDFQGHFGILMRALTYILTMGSDGLKCASTTAVLNANYLQAQLKDDYNLPHDFICKHEFVLGGLKDDCDGQVKTLDVAKRLLDMGFHPPTVYFPLIVHEALMVEPTETEPKQTLDEFVAAMKQIAQEARENKDILLEAPITTVVRRPDETEAAKKLILTYKKGE
ncbi:glycine dehydrogenase (aminomethyl-transferring) [Finegoldia magna]|jgi:glycine dehydrogenase subunit 2|uniref:Probable glycine dehydrogenase (decarboxylating) subunit 2 n=1 Tax=Finegoldia magna TaxID=1260 RepID=A0A233V0E4_FINMA|nr:aminomethyl-transferring glycine dehydrogenase subunit GcvPB [Finegoldia magna]MDU1399706.1 aminomethyl-transferring glycine dehydrogenase subunit GcvPB [Finegoldia magna]MDU5223519.1 aminomethyl-transferring glycine dehydrogenase subunit GcvPB [Finegoldia magna]MDU5976569.1 aminomethyl-transferring glycine dehydrogenase subunit GcvPB [Finegoldia magna]MDU7385573.1 aminomethyl-transferring glycine dehydrogenase subunit GcvPB [Finegoldia magna]OXZ25878.1 glycine dehydrogenase (aminomethyl-tr